MDYTLFQESKKVAREMISRGVIDPYPHSIQWLIDYPDSLIGPVLKNLDKLKKSRQKSKWLEKENSWQLPQTRRYHVSISPREIYTTQSQPNLDWLVELARWSVPKGYFGVIKSLEQYLSVPVLQGGKNSLSQSANWGDPFAFDAVLLRWYFRLSPILDIGAPWLNAVGIQAIPDRLPGIPYDDMPDTAYLWYPAGSPNSNNVHLPIPGGWILRGFLFVSAQPEDPDPISAFLRFAGSRQSETTDEAQLVARTTW